MKADIADFPMGMASYHDLTDFQHGITVGVHKMDCSLSEIEVKFEFLRITISGEYYEYKNSGKTSNL